jgi:DNA-binding NarL/FixJ family response regulator
VERGRDVFEMLRTARDFEAIEELRIETPNMVAAGRWLVDSDRVAELLASFVDKSWVNTNILPFTFMNEIGLVAEDAVARSTSTVRGYWDAIYFAGRRAYAVGNHQVLHNLSSIGEKDEVPACQLAVRWLDALTRGEFAAAGSVSREILARPEAANDISVRAQALAALALVESFTDDQAALSIAEEAVATARQLAATSTLLWPLLMLTMMARNIEPDRALAAADEAARIDRSDRRYNSIGCEATAAKIAVDNGAIAEGLRRWRRVFEHYDWVGELSALPWNMIGLADSIASSHPDLAVRLAAIAESEVIASVLLSGVIGVPGSEKLTAAVQELGVQRLESERSHAASLSYTDAMAFVFETIDRVIVDSTDASSTMDPHQVGDTQKVDALRETTRLTDRELEVLRLASQGLSNAEIAAQLHVSLKTVERHLSNSYTKLEVRNRAEAVARVVRDLPPDVEVTENP